jgi:hypothetical protein
VAIAGLGKSLGVPIMTHLDDEALSLRAMNPGG